MFLLCVSRNKLAKQFPVSILASVGYAETSERPERHMNEASTPLHILAGSASADAIAAALTGTQPKTPERVAYNIDEAAHASGLGRNGIYREINEKRLIARKYGRRTVILKEDLLAWLRALPQLAEA